MLVRKYLGSADVEVKVEASVNGGIVRSAMMMKLVNCPLTSIKSPASVDWDKEYGLLFQFENLPFFQSR